MFQNTINPLIERQDMTNPLIERQDTTNPLIDRQDTTNPLIERQDPRILQLTAEVNRLKGEIDTLTKSRDGWKTFSLNMEKIIRDHFERQHESTNYCVIS